MAKAQVLQKGELQALALTDKDKAACVAAAESPGPAGKRIEIAAAEQADALRRWLAPAADRGHPPSMTSASPGDSPAARCAATISRTNSFAARCRE